MDSGNRSDVFCPFIGTGFDRPLGQVGCPESDQKTCTEVKSIEAHHEQVTEAIPGDNVGFNVKGFGKKDIARGDVIGPSDNLPTVAEEFTAKIVILNHPSVITVGYTPVFHIHTSQVAATITEIIVIASK